MPSPSRILYTSSAVRCRTSLFSNRSRIFRRGRVAFSPMFFRSWGLLMAGLKRPGRVNYNSGFQSAWKPRGVGTDARSKKMRLLFLLLSALLAGCMLVPHKIDIQQGNYVDQAMVAKLKAEMTRSQVRFILGTPLIADIFHQNRWDYVYLTGKANDVHAR